MSWGANLMNSFWAMIKAYCFCLRNIFRYQVCTQYRSGEREDDCETVKEWDVIFIGVVEKQVEQHPNFPAGRYVWLPVRTYFGKFNMELKQYA